VIMMTKWHDVRYDYPVDYALGRIAYGRNIRNWFMENNIKDWHTLCDEEDRMNGYSFEHERDAIMFSLRWL
jgi:hypothetical protein